MPNLCLTVRHLLLGLVLVLCAPQLLAYDDSAALKGVSQGKGLFLIDLAQPQKLDLYLQIIQGTHAGMKRQGVEPDFVVVYIGPSVRFITTEPDDLLAMEHEQVLASIQASIRALRDLGVRQEVCTIANRVFGVADASIPDGMQVVADGFVSLIGWQAQGYHLVPIY